MLLKYQTPPVILRNGLHQRIVAKRESGVGQESQLAVRGQTPHTKEMQSKPHALRTMMQDCHIGLTYPNHADNHPPLDASKFVMPQAMPAQRRHAACAP